MITVKPFKHYSALTLLCVVLGVQSFSVAQKSTSFNTSTLDSATTKKKIALDGVDGPYIINDKLYRVTATNQVVTSTIDKDSILVEVNNKDKDAFYVSLQSDYAFPETSYAQPEKTIVISDIEGNFNAFSSFLMANNIIDNNYNWSYGNGHLVLVGDFVDRGKNVTQVLWLIYKLDYQARQHNGQLHFILGNHEILNFYGNYKYNHGKYIKVAQEISQIKSKKEAVKYLYSEASELGKWLASKNVIEKIGNYIFVHGGLSPELLDYQLSLEDINKLSRLRYHNKKYPKDKTLNFLYGPKGPFWYRGLVVERSKYNKITSQDLDAILNYYEATKIVIGHTPVADVSTGFEGKIIRTDVLHDTVKFTNKTKGLLIENNQEFVIDATATKMVLQ
ncbi:metallophosphoesterase [Olleya aquimaris]|uniref:Calcineurin-like phosphoesterase family protein n=1 Tax=Olleya aquimaris TaxID=639310 RepID=A0A327RIC4_9FLAO|nr:metallophosphoesterase [Olleya aquimaris]RAJ16796.1 calcineurin-like phosphoesterase family protein [Olleya aquimaris]